MARHTLTRQRISTISFSTTGKGADPKYRKFRFRDSAEEDIQHGWDRGWRVARVEIIRVRDDPTNKPTHVNQMEIVEAIITEKKVIEV